MRKVILLKLLCLVCISNCLTQDYIILKGNNDTLKCYIVKDKITSIDYKSLNTRDITIYNIKYNEYDGYVLENNKLTEDERESYIKQVQEIFTESNDTAKRVIYRSFEEFKDLKPSFTDTFFLKEKFKFLLFEYITRLYTIDSTGKEKRIRKPIWGYYNGFNTYIKFGDGYGMLNTIGRYCIFFGEKTSYNTMGVGINDTNLPYKQTTSAYYFLDYNTGDIYLLNNYNLKTRILSQDKELLESFKKEREKKPKRGQYIVKFNKKHPIE